MSRAGAEMAPRRTRKTSRRRAVQAADPLRLFAVVHATNGTIASPPPLAARSIVTAFLTGEHARQALDGADVPAEGRAAYRVAEFVELRDAPERETPWGEGQHDHVTLGPGVRAALRVTPEGRVKLTIPGGELDVTEGAASLGSGLHEASARAAQIRVRREERAERRARKGGAR